MVKFFDGNGNLASIFDENLMRVVILTGGLRSIFDKFSGSGKEISLNFADRSSQFDNFRNLGSKIVSIYRLCFL